MDGQTRQIDDDDGMSPRLRGRPKRRSDAQQRTDIVAVACAIFLDRGYGATTMDEVAARAGVSKRTLYRLVPSKTDLFRAMVADHRRSMLALPRADDDAPLEQALADIFRLDIDETENQGRLAFIRLAVADADRFPEIGEMIALEGAEVARTMLAAWLARQRERGLIAGPEPEIGARMLMDMIFSVLVKRFPGDTLDSRHERQAHARACITVFLDGSRAR